MILKFLGFYIIVIITSGFMACSGSNTSSSGKPTKFPEGMALYISKCMACHKAYEPELHTLDEWQKILDEMGSKAKLGDNDKQKILEYLSERNLIKSKISSFLIIQL